MVVKQLSMDGPGLKPQSALLSTTPKTLNTPMVVQSKPTELSRQTATTMAMTAPESIGTAPRTPEAEATKPAVETSQPTPEASPIKIPVQLGNGKSKQGVDYNPDNSLTMLRGNQQEFMTNFVMALTTMYMLSQLERNSMRFGFGNIMQRNQQGALFNIVMSGCQAPSNMIGEAIGQALVNTLTGAKAKGQEKASANGRTYTGHNEQDIEAVKVKSDDIQMIEQKEFDEIMEQHNEARKVAVVEAEDLYAGEERSCLESRKELHKNGAFGITIYNDDRQPKTVNGYMLKMRDQLEDLKMEIDERLGISDEDSRKCTLDISRTHSDGERSAFVLAFSGYDQYADRLQPILRESMESMYGGSLYGENFEYLKQADKMHRIDASVLDDVSKFDSPANQRDREMNGLDKSKPDYVDSVTLNESLLPTAYQSQQQDFQMG